VQHNQLKEENLKRIDEDTSVYKSWATSINTSIELLSSKFGLVVQKKKKEGATSGNTSGIDHAKFNTDILINHLETVAEACVKNMAMVKKNLEEKEKLAANELKTRERHYEQALKKAMDEAAVATTNSAAKGEEIKKLSAQNDENCQMIQNLKAKILEEKKKREDVETRADLAVKLDSTSQETIKKLKAQLMSVRKTMIVNLKQAKEAEAKNRAELASLQAKVEAEKEKEVKKLTREKETLANSLELANAGLQQAMANTKKILESSSSQREERAAKVIALQIDMQKKLDSLNTENQRLHQRVSSEVIPLQNRVKELEEQLGSKETAHMKSQTAGRTAKEQNAEVKKAVPMVMKAIVALNKSFLCLKCKKLPVGASLYAPCGHVICQNCAKESKKSGKYSCRLCKHKHTSGLVVSEHLDEIVGKFIQMRQKFEYLAKLEAQLAVY
jgi:chromosome segregation ATPase